MTPEAFHAAAIALPGATMTVQWGADQVYKVGGKMFAVIGAGAEIDGFSFKASDVAFEVLTQTGRGVPAPYLARAQWVRMENVAELDDAEVAGWLTNAHALIAAKLTRKARAELGI